jgi:class 3 adenylate cyclase
MTDFYDIHIKIAEIVSNNFWYNSLGDSMLFIFMGKNHSKNAYTFSIILHKYLKNKCIDFNKINDTNISFGIGIECGDVWKMKIKNKDNSEHITYLGNTINMVNRIETQTKIFADTELLVRGKIYDYLMQDLYTIEYANARLFETNYNEILKTKPSLVLMSENIMLYYIF